jgi:hypothetical protein
MRGRSLDAMARSMDSWAAASSSVNTFSGQSCRAWPNPTRVELKLLKLAQHLFTDGIERKGAEQGQAVKRQKRGVGSSIVQIEKRGAEEAEIAEH